MENKKPNKDKQIGAIMMAGGAAVAAYGYSRRNKSANAGGLAFLGIIVIALGVNLYAYA